MIRMRGSHAVSDRSGRTGHGHGWRGATVDRLRVTVYPKTHLTEVAANQKRIDKRHSYVVLEASE
jgi:hypothetical protein